MIAREILERGIKLDKLLKIPDEEQVGTKQNQLKNIDLQQAIKFWLNVAQD